MTDRDPAEALAAERLLAAIHRAVRQGDDEPQAVLRDRDSLSARLAEALSLTLGWTWDHLAAASS